MKTTVPETAGSLTPTTSLRKLGATEVNRPRVANPAKPAMAAGTKAGRTDGGTCNRRGRREVPVRSRTVSGISRTPTTAAATRARSTRNTWWSGSGAYCAIRPASSGPLPRPPMLAAVAISVADPDHRRGASSTTAAVAVPVNRPADSPDSTRPAKSSGSPRSKRNDTALSADSTSPASRTGRRPTESDNWPSRSSATMTPTAYTAKITVTMNEEKPNSRWYMRYSGVGSVVPHIATTNA